MRITFRGGKCRPIPSASSAASLIDSLIVGCAHTVSATSRSDAFCWMRAVTAAMHSVALWPIRWAPSNCVRLAVADHLDETLLVPGRHRLAQMADREAADRDRQAGVARFLLGHPDRGHFGKRVDRRRNRRVKRLRVTQRVFRRGHALGRRRVGQHAAAVGVADRVMTGDVRFQPIVHFDEAAMIDANSRAIEAELARVRPPTSGHQHAIERPAIRQTTVVR